MANYWFKPETVTLELGGRTLTIETGRLAKQAAGACLVTYGETVVLVTAVHGKPRQGIDFFPLTVDFVEKTSAAGKIPGGFFKREARLSDREVLVCRFIDRAIRPLFADGYDDDTMVMATVLSADGENAPDIAAFIGASAALSVSEIPFLGPIAAVRVGRVGGEFITNPTTEQTAESDMDFVVGGSRDALVMVEGGADAANEDDVLGALQYAHRELIRVIEMQDQLQRLIGKPKIELSAARDRSALEQEIRGKVGSRLETATQIKDKKERTDAIKAVEGEVRDGYASAFRSEKVSFDSLEAVDARRDAERQLGADVKEILHDLRAEAVRNRVLESGERIDGRGTSDIRQIACELRVVPRPHGVALFIKSVLPSAEDFPYTIRIVSETLESNGSSSMAAICGGTLSLMDAGVPIKAPVAGIAMGLITDGDRVAILSDILGDEDHLGDMDFKVAGTADGITALQMDIKIESVDWDVMKRALAQAREGRLHILDCMERETASELPAFVSRDELSRYAPRVSTITVKPDRIRDIIGPGGKVIRAIQETTGTKVDIDDNGVVTIFSPDADALAQARSMVEELTQEAELDRIYLGKVKRITDFGAFVEIFPGTDGLIHISHLADSRVEKVTDVLAEGDEVLAKCIDIDPTGRIRLSRKEALADAAASE